MWQPASKVALPASEDFKNATKAITKVEAAIDEAKLRVLTLQKDLEERKAWLALIRKLPVEILSEIFMFLSQIEHLAPMTITEVCQLWRIVALATPRAWSLIYANSPEHDKHLVQYVSTFITRSHPCRLHVWVPDSHNHDEEEEEYEYASVRDAILPLLLSYLPRIECLSIAAWQLATLSQESMPNLVRLTIHGVRENISSFFINLSQFPRLQYIDSLLCTWAKPLSYTWFPPLQYLVIETDVHSVWMDVIRHCASTLKALSLGIHYGFRQAPTVTITFPRLESLAISGWSSQRTLAWPVRMITPVLLSNEVSGTTAVDQLLHRGVKSVIYLRSDIVPDLDCYLNLREFRLCTSYEFTSTMLANKLAEELKRDPGLCPVLEVVEFEVLGSVEKQELIESVKGDIFEMIRSARKDLEVSFVHQYRPMPASVGEISYVVPGKQSSVTLWHTIVLSTPRAWSLIYASKSRHASHLAPYVSTFLERSPPCLLHISVPEEKAPTYPALLLTAHLSRIQCLSIPSTELAMLKQANMPNLTRLRILDRGEAIVPFFINQSRFPRLRTVDSTSLSWTGVLRFPWFPPLQYLAIRMAADFTWFEAITNCAKSLKSLRLTVYELLQQAHPVTIVFPKLESLTLDDFSMSASYAPWTFQMLTPALTSYEEFSHGGSARGSAHDDVKNVTTLQSNRVHGLSNYVNLRVYRLEPPYPSASKVLASQLAEQLYQNRCPVLETVLFLIRESLEGDSFNRIIEQIKSARPGVEVVMGNQFVPMPGSMEESSCALDMPCCAY